MCTVSPGSDGRRGCLRPGRDPGAGRVVEPVLSQAVPASHGFGLLGDRSMTGQCIDVRRDAIASVGERHRSATDDVDARCHTALPQELIELCQQGPHCLRIELEWPAGAVGHRVTRSFSAMKILRSASQSGV